MRPTNIIVLQEAKAITATNTGASVDLSDATGNGYLVLNSSYTGGSDQTANVKIQHSADGTTWTDSGVAFSQVTNAANKYQALYMNVDGFKKYVRVVDTLAGTSPTHTFGVLWVGDGSGN